MGSQIELLEESLKVPYSELGRVGVRASVPWRVSTRRTRDGMEAMLRERAGHLGATAVIDLRFKRRTGLRFRRMSLSGTAVVIDLREPSADAPTSDPLPSTLPSFAPDLPTVQA
ncbi:MAG: hypothetical protein ACOYML_10055 [Microthrixaceae bacterium]